MAQGNAAFQRDDLARAKQCFQRAAEIAPEAADAHFALGQVCFRQGLREDATDAFQMALYWDPDHAEAHCHLGVALSEQRRAESACEHFRRAVELKPEYAQAQSNLGCVLFREMGSLEEGEAHTRRALEIAPDLTDAHLNLGLILQSTGRTNEALREYDFVLRRQPEEAFARLNRALIWLADGEFGRGWPEYEYRFSSPDLAPRHFGYPRWDGSALAGKTILVYAEQGLGDEVLFASCLPDIVERAACCVIDCSPKLEQLFRHAFPQATIHGGLQNEGHAWLASLPKVDIQIPIGSLPLYFRNNLSAFPRHHGYLRAPEDKVMEWGGLARCAGEKFRVGLCWSGNPHHPNERNPYSARSVGLAQLAPLAKVPGAEFFNLTLNPGDFEKIALPLTDLTAKFKDFSDTAALIANLNLVISVDTAVAHLAGAMGKEVWVLLPRCPDWRWQGENSRWYPQARLFRQPAPGAWGQVIGQVLHALQQRIVS